MSRLRTVALVVAGSAAAVLAWFTVARGGEAAAPVEPRLSVEIDSPVTPPQQWSHPRWDELLGREDWREGDLGALAVPVEDGLPDPDAAQREARRALVGRLSSDPAARQGLERYLEDPFAGDGVSTDSSQRLAGSCAQPEVQAVSLARLPSPGVVAKALVLWNGDCVDGLTSEVLGGQPRDPATLQVAYVYLRWDGSTWSPVRETELPGSAAGTQDSGEMVPGDLLAPLRCGTTPLQGRARVEVASALSELCVAAAADGVSLSVDAALRSTDEQRDSDEERGVDGDGACSSRHCAGWAVDVTGDDVASWLAEVVACQLPAGTTGATEGGCESGSPVPRALSFGFAQPYRDDPGHLEYVLPPVEVRWAANCRPPASSSAPEVVAMVWRCRLAQAGLSREEVREVVARALVLARCESGLNPAVQGPVRGDTRPVGLFQLDAGVVSAANGGDAADPVANADAAAGIYLERRRSGGTGFDVWPCAAAVPGPGAVMPAWSYRW